MAQDQASTVHKEPVSNLQGMLDALYHMSLSEQELLSTLLMSVNRSLAAAKPS